MFKNKFDKALNILEESPGYERNPFLLFLALEVLKDRGDHECIKTKLTSVPFDQLNAYCAQLGGDTYFEEGDFQTAVQYYRQSLKTNEKPIPLLGKIAQCLFNQGKFKECEKWANEILVNRDPKDIKSMMLKAQCRMKQNDHKTALSWIKKVLALNSANKIALELQDECVAIIRSNYEASLAEASFRRYG